MTMSFGFKHHMWSGDEMEMEDDDTDNQSENSFLGQTYNSFKFGRNVQLFFIRLEM